MIGFAGAGRRLTMRLLGGEFLKYSSRFPAEFGSQAEMAPGPLIEAVRRVALVAERGSPVRLAFGDDEVVIEAGSQGQARAVERVPAVFAGNERVIAFSPHYLLDGLTAAAAPAGGRAASAAEDPRRGGGTGAGGTHPAGSGSVHQRRAPAVITWVPCREAGHSEDKPDEPDFRYLVVPLRMPGST